MAGAVLGRLLRVLGRSFQDCVAVALRAGLGWLLRVFGRRERRVYCWRCGRFVRALGEWEYAWYEAVFAAAKRSINEALDRGELDEARLRELRRPLEDACRRLSGEEGLEPSHLFKHRASLYGPPCRGCGRNLRTPRASRCMGCGLESKQEQPGK